MKSGIFLIDKEEGLTSFDVISKLRKKLNIKKFGHTGTLDPFATGLLVCPCNMATRISSYILEGKKIYSGIILLNTKTDTDDITGNILEKNDKNFSNEEIINASKNFLGLITQIPPRYSAIKINGKRAYDLARENKEFEIKAREVEIFDFNITKIEGNEVSFLITCSKGTYIRSIARDLGEKLRTYACLKTLRREASFPFFVSYAKKVSEVEVSDMMPWDLFFDDKLKIYIDDEEVIKKLNVGNNIFLEDFIKNSKYKDVFLKNELVVYISKNKDLTSGILVKENNLWKFAVNGLESPEI